MSYSPTQPEYYGWYPNTTVSAAFAQGVWDAIMDNEASIKFDNTKTYKIDCGNSDDAIIVNGLFKITKPNFRVIGNGSSLVFDFDSIISSDIAADGPPIFKWILPASITEMNVLMENITIKLSDASILLLSELYEKYNLLRCFLVNGKNNTFKNVQFLDFPTCVLELPIIENGESVSNSLYKNCVFQYGSSNRDLCLYIQGNTRLINCTFLVKRKYSSHAIYWGLERNNIVIKNCRFYYIGGYYPNYSYTIGQERTGTVVSWRGTTGGEPSFNLFFSKNYIENSGDTLFGYDGVGYDNTDYKNATIINNKWLNSGQVQLTSQYGLFFSKNKLYSTQLVLKNCKENCLVENNTASIVHFLNNNNLDFFNNNIDDSDFSANVSLIHSNNSNVKIKNNSFTFVQKELSPVNQWQGSNNLIIENNRFEFKGNTTSNFAMLGDLISLNVATNVFINIYFYLTLADSFFSGDSIILENIYINNSNPSSVRLFQNTASGPYTASGNEVVNGTYLGTLNNA